MQNNKATTETIEVPPEIAEEVKLFVNLLLTGEIDSLSDLLEKAGGGLTYDQQTLWNKVVDAINTPTTKVIFQQKSQLLSFDGKEATIGINRPQLLNLTQGKIPHLEAAFSQVLGTKVSVKLVQGWQK